VLRTLESTSIVKGLVDLNKDQVKKAFAYQNAMVGDSFDLVQSCANVRTQIKDIEGLSAFVNEYIEISANGSQKAEASSKTLMENVTVYSGQIGNLLGAAKNINATQ